MPYCPFRSCNQQRYFETDEALFQHARTSKRTHPCCVSCERLFVDNEAYVQHKESRHTFHCKKCNLKYRSEESLEQHFRSSKAHPSCAQCNMGVYGREALNVHMATEHPLAHCETCGVEMFKHELEMHYRTSFNHPNCTQCRVGFKNTELYNEHNLALHPDISCQICDRSFLSVEDLDRHNKEPEMHPRCKFCGGVFRHMGALIEHVAAEHFLEEMQASSSTALPTVLPLESIAATIRQKSISIPSAPQIPAESSRLPPFSAISSRPPSYLGLPLVYQHSVPDQSIESPTETSLSTLSTPPSSTGCTVTVLPTSDSDTEIVSEASNRGDESRISPDFSFSFHPTFLDTWHAQLSGTAGPPQEVPVTETVPSASPTPVTPSLLTEGLLRATESPKPARLTLPSELPNPSPLEPSTSRPKVPLAETPSGDLSDFRLLRGCQTPPRDGATSPSSLDSSPRTPKTALANGTVLHAETVAEAPTAVGLQLSFHCRICQENPCKDITATACGHLFCHSCIVEEVRSNARCPVCNAAILLFALLKLDATAR